MELFLFDEFDLVETLPVERRIVAPVGHDNDGVGILRRLVFVLFVDYAAEV